MNNYEVLGAIGQGQYGTAYKARNKLDNEMYCLKKIALSNKDDQGAALKEAQLLSSLDHPNIIGYKESFLDKDSALCISTTFCEEGDLFNKIRKKATKKEYFSEIEIMDMFIQIASALRYIHSKKILHRDLKTQNIFIAKGGIIRLGDFGISRVLEKTDSFATTVTGTPYYMAPEICTSQPYTFKSDIWSLGCVLYELCTLKHAFAADSLLSLVYQIVRGNVPPIPADMFSQDMSRLVNALLAREANDRPSLHEIFQMPYVMKHKERYLTSLEQRPATMSRTVSKGERRKALLEKSNYEADAVDDPGLTPREKLARKKEAERRKRELELQLASLNMQKQQQEVVERKKTMFHASQTGLPGANNHALRHNSAYDDDTPNYEATMPAGRTGGHSSMMWDLTPTQSHQAPATPTIHWQQGRAQGLPGPGEFGYGMDDELVNMGTMDSRMGTLPTAQATVRQSGMGVTRNGFMNPQVREQGTVGRFRDEEGVLMGSVRQDAFGVSNTNAGNVYRQFEPSYQSQQQQQQQQYRPSTAAPAYASSSQQQQQPASRSVAVSQNFNNMRQQMPQPGGRAEALRNRSPMRSPRTGGATPEAEGDDYDDDEFESYEEEEVVSQQRARVRQNVQDMESKDDREILKVQEQMSMMTKNSKTVALREKCQKELGPQRFAAVYRYLMGVRNGALEVDEREVRRKLLEILGGDNTKLNACFIVDQLVFQESLYR